MRVLVLVFRMLLFAKKSIEKSRNSHPASVRRNKKKCLQVPDLFLPRSNEDKYFLVNPTLPHDYCGIGRSIKRNPFLEHKHQNKGKLLFSVGCWENYRREIPACLRLISVSQLPSSFDVGSFERLFPIRPCAGIHMLKQPGFTYRTSFLSTARL